MKKTETRSNISAVPYQVPRCFCTLVSWEKQFCQSAGYTGTEQLIEDSDDPWDV